MLEIKEMLSHTGHWTCEIVTICCSWDDLAVYNQYNMNNCSVEILL